jgi:diaminopimelate epimerase
VQLTKHHGLANDFLVVLDEVNGRGLKIDGDLAVELCDRRRGVGADGLIHGEAPPAGADVDVIMHLYNADGSRAEMSGNGIRCLGQALTMARDGHEAILLVATDGGVRRLQVAHDDQRTSLVSVDMGPARPGPSIPDEIEARLAAAGPAHSTSFATADMGNPHLVVVVDHPAEVDLATDGPWFEQRFADGVNVEFIARTEPDTLDLRVWERGAGITQACGTGACAAAHVAHGWGLVGERVRVHMPGGTAEVQLGDTITLIGPSAHVATIELPDA